jgi:tetratricopeptide (TPR) repeat protein
MTVLGLAGADEAIRLLLTVAAAYFERGDEAYATALCQRAVDAAERDGSPNARASAYWNASVMQSRRGRQPEAIALAEKALALLSEGSDARNIARLRAQLGVMLLRSSDGDPRAAERHLKRARRDLAAGSGSVVDIARVDVDLAAARLAQGDVDAAETSAGLALEAAGEQFPLLAAEAHLALGGAAQSRRDRAATRAHFAAAAAALTAAGSDRGAAQAWYELGAHLDDSGDVEGARDAYRSAAAAAGLRSLTPQPPARARR